MNPQADFVAYCAELLAPLGTVRSKRMFGGYGLYVDDVFVAIITGDALYLKADDQTRPQFQAAGSRPFAYMRQGELQSTGYWMPPADAMDSPAAMLPWARLARDAALRSASKGSRRRR